jgi:outer membrane protein assembly factor BamB
MKRPSLSVAVSLLVLCTATVSADNWPSWRGPLNRGVTSETGLPTSWSMTSNVAWRASIPGAGVSSPVVWGDLVIVTSQKGVTERRSGSHPSLVQGADSAASGERTLAGHTATGPLTFVVSAFRWSDGSAAWTHEVRAEGKLAPVHDKHNLASPSPVTDGQVVIAWFGTGQVIALDHAGKVLWSKHLGQESPLDIQWGHGSSPALHGDLAYLLNYQPSSAYLLAVDKRTGAVRWKHSRPAGVISYSTPVVINGPSGDVVLVNSSTGMEALRADTGAPLWHILEDSRFPIPVPSLVDGVIYTTRGYRSGPYWAIKPGGSGEVSSSHTAWRLATGAPYISSVVVYDGLIYSAGDAGIISCLDAKNGERVWQERVSAAFSASPIAGDGKVYFVSESGETVVMRAGRTAEILARNRLDAHFVASPAASRGRIFLRGDDVLFAVGTR